LELKILIQKKDELDVEKINEFICEISDAKLALIHSSLRDEFVFLEHFKNLVDSISTPFLGVKVTGSLTGDGYFEDSVVYAVLCGDFNVKVHSTRIDYMDLDATAARVAGDIDNAGLCFIYSPSLLKDLSLNDALLRRVVALKLQTQFAGGVSAPNPAIATNEGVFQDRLAYATIEGINFKFHLNSGFRLDSESREYIVTESSETHIKKVNDTDFVEEYSKMQHLRPYFLNMLSNTYSRADMAYLLKNLSKTSSVMYEAVLKPAPSSWAQALKEIALNYYPAFN